MHKKPRKLKPVASQEWQGEIVRLGWGGKGIGRMDDGRLVLLDSALTMFPGELVRAQVRHKAKHAEGVITGLLQPDPQRAEPACAVAQSCGACTMWGSGSRYGELKRMMVDDLLHRQLPDAPDYTWHPAPEGTKRNRIQLHWDGTHLGFHAPRSNDIVAVATCPLAADPLSDAIALLRKALLDRALPTTPDRWELATGTPAKKVVATAASAFGTAWELEGDEWKRTASPLVHKLGGNEIIQMPGAFFQVCPQCAWDSFSEVLTGWDIRGNTLYDLYGGGGFFSLMLAERFNNITLVESSTPSVDAANQNLAGLGEHECKVSLVNARVEDWLHDGLGNTDDVILLDPPRSGLPADVSRSLNTVNAHTLVLVGCDGMSFCRDIKRLQENWQLESLSVLDLFPNTALAEFVGLLRQNS